MLGGGPWCAPSWYVGLEGGGLPRACLLPPLFPGFGGQGGVCASAVPECDAHRRGPFLPSVRRSRLPRSVAVGMAIGEGRWGPALGRAGSVLAT